MTADRILKQRQKYKEVYPNYNQLSDAEKYFLMKQAARKKKGKTKTGRATNSIRKAKTNTQTYFNEVNKHVSILSKGAGLLLKGLDNILPLVMLAGIALLGLQKYLTATNKLAEGQTVIDVLKPSSYTPSGRSTGKLSKKGLDFLISERNEAFHPEAYHIKGEQFLTIGYGHNGPDVKPGMRITEVEGRKLLANDVASAENTVNSSVKVPLTQNMFDALVCFVFNVGPTAFKESTLLKKLNKGDYKGAQQEFSRWVKGGLKGKEVVLQGLVNRRAKEAEMFGTDITSDNKIKGTIINEEKPIPKTTGSIADNYGGSWNIKSGTTIGNYTMKDSLGRDLIMSGQMEQFLKEVSALGGSGNITSVMEGDHGGTASNPKSHYSGNKADIGLGGLTTEQIIQRCIPIMRHPATVHVAFEGLGNSNEDSIRISKDIEKTLRQRYPDIANKLNKHEFTIFHWGWKYTKKYAPHLDICINPNKLNKNVTVPKTQTGQAPEKVNTNISKLKKGTQPVKANQNTTKPIQIPQNQPNQGSIGIFNNQKKKNSVNTPLDSAVQTPQQKIKAANQNYKKARK